MGGSAIERLTGGADPGRIGGKAGHISWLIANDERVPTTWVVPSDALIEAVDGVPDHGTFAVRSSANVEDGVERSYAGQFLTLLDVDRASVGDAIESVRASASSERVDSYRSRLDTPNGVSMTVIVQEMVNPVVSGVSFSRNPMTGLNETVIEAVEGRGDRLVDEGVTPDRWIRRWGTWVEQPDGSLLDESVVRAIADSTTRIAQAFGRPVDLEWVWDGQEIWWVQLRPITGLDDVSVYSNRISKEVMPGIIKPLVWSVNVPMVNRAWVGLFTEAIGPNEIRPEDLAKTFAYRSYFNMGAIGEIFELMGMPRDSLELLLGLPSGDEQPSFKPTPATMRLLPRLMRFAARKAGYGSKVEAELARINAAYAPFARAELESRSDSALLDDVRALSEIGVRAAYANIVTPLLANLHNTVLRRALTRAGLDPEGLDLGGTAELADVNPTAALEKLAALLDGKDEEAVEQIRENVESAPDEFRTAFEDFMSRFGHLSSSGNDFSIPPWSETPQAVVGMVLDHATTHGSRTAQPWMEVEPGLRPYARPVLRKLRSHTQEFIAHRERVSFTYTYGYGIFRRYFLEIGRRLAERELIAEPADVMYLYLDEVRAALIGTSLERPADLVASRRHEIAAVEHLVMPEVIYGDDFVPMMVAEHDSTLRGIPTSRGHHVGTLRVVRDTSEFSKVQPGDVIAIPFSDVGWTPLFARAGAVVAEAGGMLSHSSIVAREYRIPCVVSVAGAMRLPDGATATVDGYTGQITIDV